MKRVDSRRVALSIEALEKRQLLTGAGDPITSFGNHGGVYYEPVSGEPDVVTKAIVQPDGKIVEVGHTYGGFGMVLRLNKDGTLDTNFGADGIDTFNFPMPQKLAGTEESLPADAIVQADGSITIVGTAVLHLAGGPDLSAISTIRFTNSGGGVGNTFTPFADGFYNGVQYTGEAIVLQNGNDNDTSNDRIVLVGSTHTQFAGEDDDMFVVGLQSNGQVDPTFYHNGGAAEEFIGFGGDDNASSAVVENDGSSRNGDIILVGRSVAGDGTSNFAIARLRASDGQPDTSFSGDGKVTTPFVSEAKYDNATAAVVQASGAIAVAGVYSTTSKSASDTHLGVFRLKADGSGDSAFGVGNGQITLDAGARSAGMTVSQSGDLLVDTLLEDRISISALTADGKLDTVFSGDGKQSVHAGGDNSTQAAIATENDGTFFVAGGVGFVTASFYDRAKVTVYINSNDSNGFEDPANPSRTMSFYVHQFETLPTGTKIYFSTTGTASGPTTVPRTNVDYTGISSSILEQYVTVPAGSNSITTVLTPVDDTRPESDETATFTLIPKPGVYDIGGPSTVTLTIYDNDGQRIWGEVYNDVNGNGKFDDNKFLPGATVYLDANNNGQLDSGETSTVTDANGVYRFYAVPLGTNIIRQIPPAGYTQDDPANKGAMTLNVVTKKNYDLNPFGDKPSAPAPNGGKISGTVFNDINANLAKDSGEPGLPNITLYNDANNNSKFDSGEITTVTDASGSYTFSGLGAGSYKIRQMLPPGYTQTTPTQNFGHTVTLAGNQVVTGENFGDIVPSSGIKKTGSITGFAFNDSNKNGKYDTGDSLAAGKTVWLDLDDDGVIDSNETKLTTGSDGSFSFTDLAAGTYHVRRSFPSGYAESTPARYITLATGQATTGVAIGSKST